MTARQLALDDDVVTVAVQSAIERGLLVGDSERPDSVRLSACLVGRHEQVGSLQRGTISGP